MKFTAFIRTVFAIFIIATSASAAHAQSCSQSSSPVRFAEIGWDSGKFFSDIARTLIERGFGCKTETLPGTSPITLTAVINGNLDIFVEYWQGCRPGRKSAGRR